MTGRLLAMFGAMTLAALASAQFYSPPRGVVPGSGRIPAAAPSSIRIDQRLNTIVPGDITFTRHDGVVEQTADIFKDRPAILLLVFYKCTGVCTVELQNLQRTVRGIKKDNVGDLYDVVVVSIDPTETPAQALQKRQEFLDIYKREGTEHGFRFYVGDAENIQRLADEVGFKFYRDPKNGNITHPAGIMILSPQRRITRYFIDQEYQAKPLLLALKDARDERVGEKDDRPFFLACVNVDPLTGARSLNVMNTVKTAGVVTVLVLAFSIFRMSRSGKKQAMSEGGVDEEAKG